MKWIAKWIAVPAIFLISCLSDPSRENERGLVGSWYAHHPYTSLGTTYIGYVCFGKSGDYNFFDLSLGESPGSAKVVGMQRNLGTWSLIGDSLKILEAERGFLNDTNGIGMDWMQEMEMKPYVDSSTVRIRVEADSMFIYRPDGEMRVTTRQEPHELAKAVCSN